MRFRVKKSQLQSVTVGLGRAIYILSIPCVSCPLSALAEASAWFCFPCLFVAQTHWMDKGNLASHGIINPNL